MAIIVVLILPMPPLLLDVLLAVSIVFSVLILMTALFIQKPLEFIVLPDRAADRHHAAAGAQPRHDPPDPRPRPTGTDAAGHVIEAFGKFVMRGNFVIGVVVFAILVIVNFIVITKGSGRIAEVAARFNLDAMPGKQMAIDADLSAGLIDEDDRQAAPRGPRAGERLLRQHGRRLQVRARRRHRRPAHHLHQHHRRHDHRHDAAGAELQEAGNIYTLLTIGDGLVTQIPALIVSTAAGLLVSKAGVDGSADKALVAQFTMQPEALGMSSAVIGVVGLPARHADHPVRRPRRRRRLPRLALARSARQGAEAAVAEVAGQPPPAEPAEEPIADSLKIDDSSSNSAMAC